MNGLKHSPFRIRNAGFALALLLLGLVGLLPKAALANTCGVNNGYTVSCGTIAVGSSGSCSVGIGQIQPPPPGGSCQDPQVSGPAVISNTVNATVSMTSDGCINTWLECPVTLSITPKASGTYSTEVSVDGYYVYVTGNGEQLYGTLSLSTSTLSCGTATVGIVENCGTVTLSASGATVTLPSPLYTLSAPSGFEVTGGTCAAGEALAAGQSCTIDVELKAPSPGAYSTALQVSTAHSGSGSVSVSGSALAFQCHPDAALHEYCLVNPMK